MTTAPYRETRAFTRVVHDAEVRAGDVAASPHRNTHAANAQRCAAVVQIVLPGTY